MLHTLVLNLTLGVNHFVAHRPFWPVCPQKCKLRRHGLQSPNGTCKWRPCGTNLWPEWNSTDKQSQFAAPALCEYPATQRVLAFAKSGDAKRGFLLLTRTGEIGIYTQHGLQTVPFRWQDLSLDRWHLLRAVGNNGSTRLYCNDREIGKIPAEPDNRWPERFCGDSDARNPQGAGFIRHIRVQVKSMPQNCDVS